MKRLWVLFLSATLWAQSHEILRPTVDMDSSGASFISTKCAGNSFGSPAMPNAYDASGLSTSSTDTLTVPANVIASKESSRAFKTWATTTNTYTALTLNVNSASTGQGANLIGNAYLAYSLDGGVTWTAIHDDVNGAGWVQATNTFTLSVSQDLTKLQVAFCLDTAGDGSNAGSENITIWDIWTDGTYTPPTPTPTPNIPAPPPIAAHPSIISRLFSSNESTALFPCILEIGHLVIGSNNHNLPALSLDLLDLFSAKVSHELYARRKVALNVIELLVSAQPGHIFAKAVLMNAGNQARFRYILRR